jgi:hypothetical protein
MILAQTSAENRLALLSRFTESLETNLDLDRKLVSYQADKDAPFFRWFKYREGFTSRLVAYLLEKVHPQPGLLLDPFAGSGAALFGAAKLGWATEGIEVLPVGIYAVEARVAADRVDANLFARTVEELGATDFERHFDTAYQLQHIAITDGAFPADTERALVGYLAYCHTRIGDADVKKLALFAAFCILEDISFTRKDGQYLRWDARSGRTAGKTAFDKGKILPFKQAIGQKLHDMVHDLLYSGFFDSSEKNVRLSPPHVAEGSCLEILPTMEAGTINAALTSPPYCNRYDYTRTYALELVFLKSTHEDVTRLRQAMLSCTVENRAKHDEISAIYQRLGKGADFDAVEGVYKSVHALQEVLNILDDLRDKKELNNPHIARMVRNYFYEMCFVIFEMSRLLTPDGHIIMVNDNVQYAGEEVPVDLILSSMAESFGLTTEKIWTLARGKGNSSQQMGIHGRSELRKCVYVWRKPTATRATLPTLPFGLAR